MIRHGLWFFIFVITGLLNTTWAATEITSGVLYDSGTKLKASNFGVEFSVPNGWQAVLLQGSDALIMERANAVARIVVSAEANSDESSIRQFLMQAQSLDMHSQLVPVANVKKQGNIFSQDYRIEGFNQQKLGAKLFVQLGKNNVAFAIMILEPVGSPQFTSIAVNLVKTVKFFKPIEIQNNLQASTGNINWEQQLKGRTLQYLYTGNGLSTKKKINLCSDYSFSYNDNDSYLSSNAMNNFSANNNASESGRWNITGDQLNLLWNNGSQTNYKISRRYVSEWDEWGTFLNEDRWFNVNNEVCP